MRPKKVILVVDPDTQLLAERCYMLRTHGYNVLPAASALDALVVLAARPVDLLICEMDLKDMAGEEFVRRAKGLQPELPRIVTSRILRTFDRNINCEVFLPKGTETAENLLLRAKLLCTRKRGPKKVVRESEAA